MLNNVKKDCRKEPASIAVVPGLIQAGVEFFYNFFMQIQLIWHSKDYRYLGPHQWNDNIRIGSVTTSSRNKWVGPLIVSRTSANDRSCSTVRNYSSLGLTRRRERGNKIPNVGPLCKFPWPINYRIIISFMPIHDVNLNRYCGNIVPITACLLGINLGLQHECPTILVLPSIYLNRTLIFSLCCLGNQNSENVCPCACRRGD